MAETSLQSTIAVGDRVVYPNQGVCRVFGVEAKEVAGQKLTFVTMRREEDGALVMVPQSKVDSIGLRRVATKEDVGKIFTFLKSDSDKAHLDWKQRARMNLDRMSQGGIQGLAEVVKGLQVLSELRPLPTKERELYDNARHLLVSEISASLGVPECDAEDAVDVVLFPPGRERPKRTAEEFRSAATEAGEDLELGEDLLTIGGDVEAPAEEEEAAEEEGAEKEDSAEEPAPASKSKRHAAPKATARHKHPAHKAKPAAKAAPRKKERAAPAKHRPAARAGKPASKAKKK
jgi:RNA polymerase-interacting CarD/CdnL/TRCF family regulator